MKSTSYNYPSFPIDNYITDTAASANTSLETAAENPTSRSRCCCKESMLDALRLLCNNDLARYIDFKKFAFLTPSYLVGSKYVLLEAGSDTKDNLAELSGEFKRFHSGTCDLIDIAGTAVFAFPIPLSLTEQAEHLIELIERIIDLLSQAAIGGTLIAVLREIVEALKIGDFTESVIQAIIDFLIDWFTTLPEITSASVCQLEAVAFEVKDSGSLSTANFCRAKEYLQDRLDGNHSHCNDNCSCDCDCDCDDCCCNEGVIGELLSSNASRTVTLTVGGLAIQDALILGHKGNVLVLANEADERFYFICADHVQFLG